MTPIDKTNTVLGLPNASMTVKIPKLEGLSDSDENSSNETVNQDTEEFIVLFINENSHCLSPILEIKINTKFVVNAIIDSGSEVNLISQEIYERLTQAGNAIPVLPVENVVLVTAFGKKSKRIRLQAFLEFKLGDDVFEEVFMVSPRLSNDAILGCQFFKEFGITIDFKNESISYVRGGAMRYHEFTTKGTLQNDSEKNVSGTVREIVLSSTSSADQRTQVPVADCNDPLKTRAVNSCLALQPSQPNTAGIEMYESVSGGSSPLLQSLTRTKNVSEGSNSLKHGTKGGHSYDISDAETSDELLIQGCDPVDWSTAKVTEIKVNSLSKRRLSGCEPTSHPTTELTEPRSLTEHDVATLVGQVRAISETQREKLFEVLNRYLQSLTTKPGKCSLLEYRFRIDTDKPIVGYSRPIPFAHRPAVRQQINQMLADDILEISTSPILNPLTVVKKENGKIRLCVDARKVNQYMIPDRERAPPIQELLQKFHGTRYLTSIDLSSAFHQVESHKDSRPYTAFLYDSTVYQFKRVPYGFKNSLSAFIRAMKAALGEGSLEYVVFYVDDVLIYSRSFEEHMMHLDAVLSKLTTI
jgi:hypothetical protein